jgi:hypothetical protein
MNYWFTRNTRKNLKEYSGGVWNCGTYRGSLGGDGGHGLKVSIFRYMYYARGIKSYLENLKATK